MSPAVSMTIDNWRYAQYKLPRCQTQGLIKDILQLSFTLHCKTDNNKERFRKSNIDPMILSNASNLTWMFTLSMTQEMT